MVCLRVEAMKCGGCANSITKAIKGADPAAEIDVDVEGRSVTVDSSANLKTLIEAIRQAGYEAKAA